MAENSKTMNLTLMVWRQKDVRSGGGMEKYEAAGVSPDMSFLEMLDVVNEGLIKDNKDPIAFDSDCREGICGTCGFTINGEAHGPESGTTVCQLHMRHFKDGDTIFIEPFRARAFPVQKDLMVDRSAFDRIIRAGGYISVNTGSAPNANDIPVAKTVADEAMDSAECIGCGACVAACPNASASLFTSAKISHLGILPQGAPEAAGRVMRMVERMDAEGFGNCSNHAECEAVCPKGISVSNIATMRREWIKSAVK
ncbi:MAG: succinate dehydrogenase/fumarate reductase iron-sulfur subunit [Candidatus Dadabacteria bacterium]|nr:succinate dehydrogenase/fumarate reductase iron-sulfur subunit [Candidatus Dadabacteria bacterium]